MNDNLFTYYTRKRDQYMNGARLMKRYIAADLVKSREEAMEYVAYAVRTARHANHIAIEMRHHEKAS